MGVSTYSDVIEWWLVIETNSASLGGEFSITYKKWWFFVSGVLVFHRYLGLSVFWLVCINCTRLLLLHLIFLSQHARQVLELCGSELSIICLNSLQGTRYTSAWRGSTIVNGNAHLMHPVYFVSSDVILEQFHWESRTGRSSCQCDEMQTESDRSSLLLNKLDCYAVKEDSLIWTTGLILHYERPSIFNACRVTLFSLSLEQTASAAEKWACKHQKPFAWTRKMSMCSRKTQTIFFFMALALYSAFPFLVTRRSGSFIVP